MTVSRCCVCGKFLGLYNRPRDCKNGVSRSTLPAALSLAKPLHYIPACCQGPFTYLAMSLCLTYSWGWLLRFSYQNTKVQQSKLIIWLLTNKSHQALPTHPNIDVPFSPWKPLLQAHQLLSLPCPEAAPPHSLSPPVWSLLTWRPLQISALLKVWFAIRSHV